MQLSVEQKNNRLQKTHSKALLDLCQKHLWSGSFEMYDLFLGGDCKFPAGIMCQGLYMNLP